MEQSESRSGGDMHQPQGFPSQPPPRPHLPPQPQHPTQHHPMPQPPPHPQLSPSPRPQLPPSPMSMPQAGHPQHHPQPYPQQLPLGGPRLQPPQAYPQQSQVQHQQQQPQVQPQLQHPQAHPHPQQPQVQPQGQQPQVQPQSQPPQGQPLLVPTRRIQNGNEAFLLPLELINNRDIFCHVLSPERWDEISPEDRKRLKELLPVKAEATETEVSLVAKGALERERNCFFGSVLERAQQRLADGWLNADGPCEAKQLRDNARLAYDHMIRRYHINLLKKLLVSRRRVLEATAAVAVDERPRLPLAPSVQDTARHARSDRLRRRAAKRARLMLADVSAQAGDPAALSSDDEDLANVPQKLVIGAVGEPTLGAPGQSDLHLYQPLEPADLNSMLREYRLLKSTQPEHPVLELADVRLEDVIERAGLDHMAEKVGLPVNNPSRPLRKLFPSPSSAKK